MSHVSAKVAIDTTEFDWEETLVGALAAEWPRGRLDEYCVSAMAAYRPRLMAALAPFEPRMRRGRSWLSPRTVRRIADWLAGAVGRDIGDWRIERDLIGWLQIVRADQEAT